MRPLEIWGGVECTYNRVENSYHDQFEKSGHGSRKEDLAIIASLGLKKIRYPFLWEKISPTSGVYDWSWSDERVKELGRLGVEPIAGFLHHGSGPEHTNLLDPDFPQKLMVFAGEFAKRYPQINDYTPINEILTTARFSCLYGHWYPHKKDDHSFLKAVINQCKATILAMREIRKINPKARLIQTDDMGKCQSTIKLKYQCDFENERRWLAFDLLCGKVNKEHELYKYILENGIPEADLKWFQKQSSPPDVMGLNHYHLSNRWLDHRTDLYPEWARGGNGRHLYADVGAVDSGRVEPPLPQEIMKDTWERYGKPIVMTEVHMRGYREEQMRWFYQMWEAAKLARSEGIDVEAITAWSLLGTFDWHSLCTKNDFFYEPGVFDLRSIDQKPKATALSKLIQGIAQNDRADHPLLEEPGYWVKPRRILFGAKFQSYSIISPSKARPVLITGRNGTLGQAFARICGERNIPYKILSRLEMDITDEAMVRHAINEIKPWAIINAAGFVNVNEAENNRERCFLENVVGPENLAKACSHFKIPFVTFSSDLVFDGAHNGAYLESHPLSPINTYGESKALCEKVVLSLYPESLIIRTSSFFGPWDSYNFVTQTLNQLSRGEKVSALSNVRVSPTYVPDLVHETLNLLIDGETGVHHITNDADLSWAELAELSLKYSSLPQKKASLIIKKSFDEMDLKAKLPRNSVLSSEKRGNIFSIEEAMKNFFIQTETLH